VIGAGPAGLSFGAAIKNKRVLIVEKKAVPGVPVKSSAGTFFSTITRFNLADAVCHAAHRFRIVLDNGWFKDFQYERPVLYTLDFARMCAILKERAEKNCLVQTGARVENVELENNRIKAVKIGGEVFTADLYIDASGEARTLVRHLAPAYFQKQWLVYGLEFEMDRLALDSDRFDFYFGNRIIPEGYAWIFPTGGRSARIGLGKLVPGKGGRRKVHLRNALERFLSSGICPVNIPGDFRIRETHRGIMTYFRPLSRTFYQNTFVIGDAASQSSCLLGEGIRFCLMAGQDLAEALNVRPPADAARHYERTVRAMTRYFSQFTWFLRCFVYGPNRVVHSLVRAMSEGDAVRLERIMKSSFRTADFVRIPASTAKHYALSFIR
jgi:digeranylgeranylglycerophospholipid reductase